MLLQMERFTLPGAPVKRKNQISGLNNKECLLARGEYYSVLGQSVLLFFFFFYNLSVIKNFICVWKMYTKNICNKCVNYKCNIKCVITIIKM